MKITTRIFFESNSHPTEQATFQVIPFGSVCLPYVITLQRHYINSIDNHILELLNCVNPT